MKKWELYVDLKYLSSSDLTAKGLNGYNGSIRVQLLAPAKGIKKLVTFAGVSRFRLGSDAQVACRGQSLASKNIRLNTNDNSNELMAA